MKLSDKVKECINDIYKYDGVYSLTGKQFKEIMDTIVYKIEAQEALIKKMLKEIENMNNAKFYYGSNCNVMFCSDKTCCKQNNLKNIIQQAKEIE